MSRAADKLRKLIASVRRSLTFPRNREPEDSRGDGCYALSDGTLIPLGDIGLTPTEYKLEA